MVLVCRIGMFISLTLAQGNVSFCFVFSQPEKSKNTELVSGGPCTEDDVTYEFIRDPLRAFPRTAQGKVFTEIELRQLKNSSLSLVERAELLAVSWDDYKDPYISSVDPKTGRPKVFNIAHEIVRDQNLTGLFEYFDQHFSDQVEKRWTESVLEKGPRNPVLQRQVELLAATKIGKKWSGILAALLRDRGLIDDYTKFFSLFKNGRGNEASEGADKSSEQYYCMALDLRGFSEDADLARVHSTGVDGEESWIVWTYPDLEIGNDFVPNFADDGELDESEYPQQTGLVAADVYRYVVKVKNNTPYVVDFAKWRVLKSPDESRISSNSSTFVISSSRGLQILSANQTIEQRMGSTFLDPIDVELKSKEEDFAVVLESQSISTLFRTRIVNYFIGNKQVKEIPTPVNVSIGESFSDNKHFFISSYQGKKSLILDTNGRVVSELGWPSDMGVDEPKSKLNSTRTAVLLQYNDMYAFLKPGQTSQPEWKKIPDEVALLFQSFVNDFNPLSKLQNPSFSFHDDRGDCFQWKFEAYFYFDCLSHETAEGEKRFGQNTQRLMPVEKLSFQNPIEVFLRRDEAGSVLLLEDRGQSKLVFSAESDLIRGTISGHTRNRKTAQLHDMIDSSVVSYFSANRVFFLRLVDDP